MIIFLPLFATDLSPAEISAVIFSFLPHFGIRVVPSAVDPIYFSYCELRQSTTAWNFWPTPAHVCICSSDYAAGRLLCFFFFIFIFNPVPEIWQSFPQYCRTKHSTSPTMNTFQQKRQSSCLYVAFLSTCFFSYTSLSAVSHWLW